jgi:hypothetical protein
MNKIVSARTLGSLLLVLFVSASTHAFAGNIAIFNVKDYGATGVKTDNAQGAIQKAIDACGQAGGGMVYLPPGEYTSGTLYLRSHIRFHIEGGATLYASKEMSLFNGTPQADKAALFFADQAEDITLEGRGTVNGQGAYEWKLDDLNDPLVRPAKDLMRSLGKSLMRSFPEGYPDRKVYPHLVWMGNSTDIRITGLSFIYSPTWTMAFHACQRLVMDGVYIYTKPNDAVWADGVDLDGCNDVRIANCSITTGDDCIVFVSIDSWGPARTCENVVVTNCRLSSSANAIKFSEGNAKGVRHIAIDNCVINDDSSGFSFASRDGGAIEDVVISNITINTRRFGWFWGQGGFMGMGLLSRENYAGKPISKSDPAPGSIHNIVFRNIIAHCKGGAYITGHPNGYIDGLTYDNIKFFVGTDPSAPFDWTTDAMTFRWVKNLKLRDVEIHWETPEAAKWRSAIHMEEVDGVEIDGFEGRQAKLGAEVPSVQLTNVSDVMIRASKAPEGTGAFLKISGSDSHGVTLFGNDLRKAKVAIQLDSGLENRVVTEMDNFMPAK